MKGYRKTSRILGYIAVWLCLLRLWQQAVVQEVGIVTIPRLDRLKRIVRYQRGRRWTAHTGRMPTYTHGDLRTMENWNCLRI